MEKHLSFPGVYLTDADTGKRLNVTGFEPGDALVVAPKPILGYYRQEGHLTVYVSGTMPLALRTAREENRTELETWLVPELPQGIQEIELPDRQYLVKKAA